jgi:hypothetical protein
MSKNKSKKMLQAVFNSAFRDLVITQGSNHITLYHVWDSSAQTLDIQPLVRLFWTTADEFLDTLREATDIAVERRFGVKDRMTSASYDPVLSLFNAEWEVVVGRAVRIDTRGVYVSLTTMPDHAPRVIVAES